MHLRRHGYFEFLLRDIKSNEYSEAGGDVTERMAVPDAVVKDLAKTGGTFGIKLSQAEQTALSISNTFASLVLCAWMTIYFNLVGDPQPSIREIHLEKQPKGPIYEEYKDDMLARNDCYLSKSYFLQIWRKAFPYVKIREYKHVCGTSVIEYVLHFSYYS